MSGLYISLMNDDKFKFSSAYKVLLFYVLVLVGPKKHLSREFGPHHNYHNQSQISEIFSLTQPATKTSQAFGVIS